MMKTEIPQLSSSDLRLVEAAREVFAREGLRGATTREIARVAGVNEVTLFRRFENKANLLGAVLKQVVRSQVDRLAELTLGEEGLVSGLLEFARCYYKMLSVDEALIRTLIGEANRYPDLAQQVTHQCSAPWRESLTQFLSDQQAAGRVRTDFSMAVAVDMFSAWLLAGMLRQTSPWKPAGYTEAEYLEETVRIFARGIATEKVDL